MEATIDLAGSDNGVTSGITLKEPKDKNEHGKAGRKGTSEMALEATLAHSLSVITTSLGLGFFFPSTISFSICSALKKKIRLTMIYRQGRELEPVSQAEKIPKPRNC